MIIRPKPTLFTIFFILKGSVVQAIFPRLLLVLGTALFISFCHQLYPIFFKSFSIAPFTLIGASLSIFLGFRNNACYERWWEARKLLGSLIFELRSYARLVTSLSKLKERQRLVRRGIGFSHALVDRLRSGDYESVRKWLPKEEWARVHSLRNVPNGVLNGMTQDLATAMNSGQITDVVFKIFTTHVTNMSAIQAGCERILFTPLPYTYSLLLHRTALVFCLLLPLALVDSFGWFTAFPTIILAYAFFGLDALGDELEEPFGLTQNDLPLNAIARTIEIELLETLGETKLPEPLKPIDYLLQ